jgi:hypothetical protein
MSALDEEINKALADLVACKFFHSISK